MKIKLLRRLRREGRAKVNVYSVSNRGGMNVGMRYGYDEEIYSGLFNLGDTETEVKDKAARIYIENYLQNKRAK